MKIDQKIMATATKEVFGEGGIDKLESVELIDIDFDKILSALSEGMPHYYGSRSGPNPAEEKFWYGGAKVLKVRQKGKPVPDYIGVSPVAGCSASAISPLTDYELMTGELEPENPEQDKVGGQYPAYHTQTGGVSLLLDEFGENKATAIVCVAHIAQEDNPGIMELKDGKMSIAKTKGTVSYRAYSVGLGSLNGQDVAVDYAIGHVLIDGKLYSAISQKEIPVENCYAPAHVGLWAWKLLESLD